MLAVMTLTLHFTYREEIERKTRALAIYGGFTDSSKVDQIIKRAWNLEHEQDTRGFVF